MVKRTEARSLSSKQLFGFFATGGVTLLRYYYRTTKYRFYVVPSKPRSSQNSRTNFRLLSCLVDKSPEHSALPSL